MANRRNQAAIHPVSGDPAAHMTPEPSARPEIEISIVSPVYQAASIVPHLVQQIAFHLTTITDNFEILLVEDGSRDDSWQSICVECDKDTRVKGMRLSRNFGQHYAISAGLAASVGRWVVVMDCDLQDRPDQIPLLYQRALQGYDTVCAQRISRNDSALKRFYSKAFYRLFSYLTETDQDASIGNFGIYSRNVIQSVLSMEDSTRYFPTMVQWVGFRRTKLPVLHAARHEGKTTYNFRKLLRLAVNTIVSFSDKPLRLVVLTGLTISAAAFLIGIGFLVGHLLGWISVAGYTSLIVSIWLTAGINVFVLGIVGLYVGKTFEKTKGRPAYIVSERVNS